MYLICKLPSGHYKSYSAAGKRSASKAAEDGPPAKKKHPEEDARPRGFDRGLQVFLST